MFTAAAKALAEMFTPPLRAVLVKAIGLALVMALILIFRPNGLSRGRELVLPSGRPAPAAPAGLSPRPEAAS